MVGERRAPRFVEVPADLFEEMLVSCGFERHVQGRELVYVRAHHRDPRIVVKVYTTIPANGASVRDCGEDAVRICVVFTAGNRSSGLAKAKVLRTAPAELEHLARVQHFLDRVKTRMREAYAFANRWLDARHAGARRA